MENESGNSIICFRTFSCFGYTNVVIITVVQKDEITPLYMLNSVLSNNILFTIKIVSNNLTGESKIIEGAELNI